MNIKHLFWTCASQIYFMWIVDFIKMLICQLFYIFKLGWQAINESERVKRDKAGLATFLVKQFKNLNGLRFLQIIKMEKALFFCFKYVLLKKHYFFPSLFLFFFVLLETNLWSKPCRGKILPQLINAFEFSNAGSAILGPVFKIGKSLNTQVNYSWSCF